MNVRAVITLALLVCTGTTAFSGNDPSSSLEGTGVLRGRIADVEGLPMEGARVFLYDNAEVRRSANFISAPTGGDGIYRMAVPPGRYWAMARLKKSEGYGALMPGDRHSGDPVVAEVTRGKEAVQDFVVTDLKEALKLKARERERPYRITGRIVDEQGAPVPGAYATAHRSRNIAGIPDQLSATTDQDGRYTLFLPGGRYSLGSAIVFPPGRDFIMSREVLIDADREGLDMVRTSP